MKKNYRKNPRGINVLSGIFRCALAIALLPFVIPAMIVIAWGNANIDPNEKWD